MFELLKLLESLVLSSSFQSSSKFAASMHVGEQELSLEGIAGSSLYEKNATGPVRTRSLTSGSPFRGRAEFMSCLCWL